jgi:hypothetical protein
MPFLSIFGTFRGMSAFIHLWLNNQSKVWCVFIARFRLLSAFYGCWVSRSQVIECKRGDMCKWRYLRVSVWSWVKNEEMFTYHIFERNGPIEWVSDWGRKGEVGVYWEKEQSSPSFNDWKSSKMCKWRFLKASKQGENCHFRPFSVVLGSMSALTHLQLNNQSKVWCVLSGHSWGFSLFEGIIICSKTWRMRRNERIASNDNGWKIDKNAHFSPFSAHIDRGGGVEKEMTVTKSRRVVGGGGWIGTFRLKMHASIEIP